MTVFTASFFWPKSRVCLTQFHSISKLYTKVKNYSKLVFPLFRVHASEEWLWLRKLFVCPRRTSYIHYIHHTTSRARLTGLIKMQSEVHFNQSGQNRKSLEMGWRFPIVSSCVHMNKHGRKQISSFARRKKPLRTRLFRIVRTIKINQCKAKQSDKPRTGRGPDTDTPVPQRLETSLWGSGGTVQREVVNQNESRDLGNTNTNIILLNTTGLTSFN